VVVWTKEVGTWNSNTVFTHSGPVNDVAWVGSSFDVASCSDDGLAAVSTPTGEQKAKFAAFDGAAVRSVLVGRPSGCPDYVLVTGSQDNKTLKVWDAAGAMCHQKLTFSSSDGEPFRGTTAMDPFSEYVIVANTAADSSSRAWSVFALHLNASGGAVRFDCSAEFAVLYPVISCR
jgi:WD40 repeat protein